MSLYSIYIHTCVQCKFTSCVLVPILIRLYYAHIHILYVCLHAVWCINCIPNTTTVPTRRGLTVLLAVVHTTASLISRRDQIEKDARELSLKIKDHQPGTTVSPHTLHLVHPLLTLTYVHASTSMIPTTGTDTMRRGFIMCLCVCFYVHTYL